MNITEPTKLQSLKSFKKKMKTKYEHSDRPHDTSIIDHDIEQLFLNCNLTKIKLQTNGMFQVKVTKRIRKLAKEFDINLKTCEYSSLEKARDQAKTYTYLIHTELWPKICELRKNEDSMLSGKFDFLCPCDDVQAFNHMMTAIAAYYAGIIANLNNICKRLVKNKCDLSDLEKDIQMAILIRDQYDTMSELYKEADNMVNLLTCYLSDIKTSGCFSNEVLEEVSNRLQTYYNIVLTLITTCNAFYIPLL